MAKEQKHTHLILEIIAIIISIYFLSINTLFFGWERIALVIIATSVIIIDIYALLMWFELTNITWQKNFHMLTEGLALPAGIILITLSQKENLNTIQSTALLITGISNILIDGYLLSTWPKKKKSIQIIKERKK